MSSSPRVVTYIDKLDSWWPATAVAASLAVPGYTRANGNNVVNLAFWTTSGPADAAMVWSNPLNYVGDDNPWGTSVDEVQKAWVKAYHGAGVKVLVSAFGSTDFPTSGGKDPTAVGTQLAQFVLDNNLDGCDLDWEDNDAMNAGKGEAWIIACTQAIRKLLPVSEGYIVSHAPQAPYFTPNASIYPSGGYGKVAKEVGNLIDFYNIQFYNQGSSEYTTFATMFQQSDGWAAGTSVGEIHANCAIPLSKLIVGKPVTKADVVNTGFISVDTFVSILKQAVASTQWNGGVMGWQFSSDADGSWSSSLASALVPSNAVPRCLQPRAAPPHPAGGFAALVVLPSGALKRVEAPLGSLRGLLAAVARLLSLPDEPSCVWWVDEEGDVCVVGSEAEWDEVLRVGRANPLAAPLVFHLSDHTARACVA